MNKNIINIISIIFKGTEKYDLKSTVLHLFLRQYYIQTKNSVINAKNNLLEVKVRRCFTVNEYDVLSTS